MRTKLTPKQDVFALEYAKSHNATKSAVKAGYSPRTAYSSGSRLLKNVDIQQRLDDLGTTGLNTLERVALNGKNEIAQVAAAKTLVEYGIGKPTGQDQHTQINIIFNKI